MESMIHELTPEDLAQQMCIYNCELFKKINAIEFLNQIWRKPSEEQDFLTPSLDFFIQRFDKESYWVATELCMVKDIKKRLKVVQTFIRLAKLCEEHRNYFSMFSIIAGLNLSPVQRLKKTWEVRMRYCWQ